MATLRRTLAQPTLVLLSTLLGCVNGPQDRGQQRAAAAAPAGREAGVANHSDSTTSDRGLPAPMYELCDGSAKIRLGLKSEGGEVDAGFFFTHPYGHRFLFVDGKCNFIAKLGGESHQGFLGGTLSAAQTRALEDALELSAFRGFTFLDQGTCGDGGTVSITTPSAYGEVACNGRADAPQALTDSLEGAQAAFQLVASVGEPLSGPIEIIALSDFPDGSVEMFAPLLLRWPYPWSVDEIAGTQGELSEHTALTLRPRVIEGAEARVARDLRAQAKQRRHGLGDAALVSDGGRVYSVFMRDRIAPELADAMRAFEAEHNPRAPKTLLPCAGRALRELTFDDASVFGTQLHVHSESKNGCLPRLCWDASFGESAPVVARLQAIEPTDASACSGAPQSYASHDLSPIKEAFGRSYPGLPVEVRIALSGWNETELLLRH